MERAKCLWCGDPVPQHRDTCSFQCYILWYAWYEQQARIIQGARLVQLREDEAVPNDLDQQPWYARVLEGKEAMR